LKPKKVKDLIPELSKQLQLSESDIKAVVDVYWAKIRKTLSSLEHDYVSLPGLGTFGVKSFSVDKKIKINNHIIDRYIENPTSGGLTIINELSKDNLKLTAAKSRLEELSIRKKQIKDERHKQNLERKEEDI